MLCPLGAGTAKCVKERCAWWVESDSMCAVTCIGKAMSSLPVLDFEEGGDEGTSSDQTELPLKKTEGDDGNDA